MASKLYTTLLDATKRRKNTSGSGSTYGKGWNAAMDDIARTLTSFADDGVEESRVRYEWAIRNGDGSVHRVTVARAIADAELAEQLEKNPGQKAEVVCRKVVAQLHGDWEVPSEAGVY